MTSLSKLVSPANTQDDVFMDKPFISPYLQAEFAVTDKLRDAGATSPEDAFEEKMSTADGIKARQPQDPTNRFKIGCYFIEDDIRNNRTTPEQGLARKEAFIKKWDAGPKLVTDEEMICAKIVLQDQKAHFGLCSQQDAKQQKEKLFDKKERMGTLKVADLEAYRARFALNGNPDRSNDKEWDKPEHNTIDRKYFKGLYTANEWYEKHSAQMGKALTKTGAPLSEKINTQLDLLEKKMDDKAFANENLMVYSNRTLFDALEADVISPDTFLKNKIGFAAKAFDKGHIDSFTTYQSANNARKMLGDFERDGDINSVQRNKHETHVSSLINAVFEKDPEFKKRMEQNAPKKDSSPVALNRLQKQLDKLSQR